MTTLNLFHAYIVGGSREDARRHIDELLSAHNLFKKNSADCVTVECVSFSIDNARELRAWQELVPSEGARKTYIVYADFITREAENALLKTFEEPTPGTHIIFAVPKPEVLLPTLLSRVRVLTPAKISAEIFAGDARKFLALSPKDRLASALKLVEKSEDEDGAAEVRERTLALLDGLEKELSGDAQKNNQKLETILKFKKYLYMSGASSRMILETLALTL